MATTLGKSQQLFAFDPDIEYNCPRCGSADTWVTSTDGQHMLCKGCGNDISPSEWDKFAQEGPVDLVWERLGLMSIFYQFLEK